MRSSHSGYYLSRSLDTINKLPNSEYDEEGMIPVVDQGQNLIGGYTNRENLKITTDLPLIGFGDHTRILKYIDFEFVPGADGIKILKPSKEFDPKFFYYAVKSSNILDLGYSRHFKILREVIIPQPPLPIQRQIVAVLEQAEAVKQQRKEADALTGALLQSVFLEMFGDPVRNEREWDVKSVEEICETSRTITYGIVQPGEDMDDGIPIVRPSDLLDTYVNNNIGLKKVDPAIELEYPRSRLKGGEFLISVRGTMGPMSIAGPDLADANLSRGVALVAPNSTCCSEYLLFLFKNPTMKQVVVDTSKGIALKQFNLIDLKKMQIPIPPLALQQQFARIVQDVERVREQQVKSGKEIEGLCKGLMQRAFAGEMMAGKG